MAANTDRKNKDKQMAAFLRSKGIFHGNRQTSGHCPICYGPKHYLGTCPVSGSTKYRRRR